MGLVPARSRAHQLEDLVTAPDPRPRGWLLASAGPLVSEHDVVLLDLDGTVYVGETAVPGAAAVVATLRLRGVRPAFVTNNASRTPAAVADQLTGLGIPCSPSEVVTAAQAGARLVAERVPPGAKVLVVGGEGVREALLEVGLQPVDRADEGAVALLQGWSPQLGWSHLAEGAYAIAAGLPWVVTNTDSTLPTPRGIAPGNGSFVALLAGITGRSPDAVAGKPLPPLLEQSVARLAALRPLVVGDRLDTDIEGASAVGLPSLLVLSGVTDVRTLLAATPMQRPTYLARDVAGLLDAHRTPVQVPAGDRTGWRCGGSAVVVASSSGLSIMTEAVSAGGPSDHGEPGADDLLRACCAAAWAAADTGHELPVSEELIATLQAAPTSRP
jgi:glycerol 3-phosphatase-2